MSSVLWAPPPRKGSKKSARSKIKAIRDLAGRRIAVIGRTQINVNLLRVILTESGVDPDKVTVEQFGTDEIAEMLRDTTINAFMTVGPADSETTAEAIVATARARGGTGVLAGRRFGSDRRAAPAVRIRGNSGQLLWLIPGAARR